MYDKKMLENMLAAFEKQRDTGNLIGEDQYEQLMIQECGAQEDYGGPLCQYDGGDIIVVDTGNPPTPEVEAAIRQRVKQRSANESLKAQSIINPIKRMEGM